MLMAKPETFTGGGTARGEGISAKTAVMRYRCLLAIPVGSLTSPFGEGTESVSAKGERGQT